MREIKEVKRWKRDLTEGEITRISEAGKFTGMKEEYLGTDRTPSGQNRMDMYLVLDDDGVYRVEYRLQWMDDEEMERYCAKKERVENLIFCLQAVLAGTVMLVAIFYGAALILSLCSTVGA